VNTEQLLVMEGVRRSYGSVEAVAGIDLRVGGGETVALLGPNGAGKSTTLAMLLGLLHPTSGRIAILGRSPRQAIGDGLIGAMLQSGIGGGVPPGVRVRELVEFVASLYPDPLAPPTVMARAGLGSLAGRKVDALSGGELQRVRFALAISANPRLLVLDEPTVGLDVPAQRSFWDTVTAFAGEGRVVLFATHYLAEAEEVAKRAVVLNRGRVVADGPVDEIRRAVAAKWVRFRAQSIAPGTLEALPGVTRAEAADGIVAIQTSDSDATVRGLYRSSIPFSDLEVTGARLEEAFLALTAEEARPR
jgi:ABC-2 type transport system ATP-binding protein